MLTTAPSFALVGTSKKDTSLTVKDIKTGKKKAEIKQRRPDVIKISKEKKINLGKPRLRIPKAKSKGIWVNIWNYPTDLEAFMKKLKDFDFDTIYLQINRSTTPMFKHKEKVDEILKVAHKKNIKVIGWTYCYLRDIATDAKKYIEPALYVSPDGERLDGMAADIEENTSEWAISKYTNLIKAKIPEDFPMMAIVFAPKIKPKYPWKYIGNNWDVMMPMTYWHGRKHRTIDDVYNFIKHTVLELRRLTGKRDLKIHLITDGERTSAEEVKASLKAAKRFRVNAGVSLYPEHLAPQSILEVIKDF